MTSERTAADPRVERLRVAAAARTANALARVRATVRQMTNSGTVINFRAVSRASGVSIDFLYRNPEARALIDRKRQSPPVRPVASGESVNPHRTVEQTLALRLQEAERLRREEVAALRAQLEAANGEIVVLQRVVRELRGE